MEMHTGIAHIAGSTVVFFNFLPLVGKLTFKSCILVFGVRHNGNWYWSWEPLLCWPLSPLCHYCFDPSKNSVENWSLPSSLNFSPNKDSFQTDLHLDDTANKSEKTWSIIMIYHRSRVKAEGGVTLGTLLQTFGGSRWPLVNLSSKQQKPCCCSLCRPEGAIQPFFHC